MTPRNKPSKKRRSRPSKTLAKIPFKRFIENKLAGTRSAIDALKKRERSPWEETRLMMFRMHEIGFKKVLEDLSPQKKLIP